MSNLEIIKQIESKYNIQLTKVEKISLTNTPLKYGLNSLKQVVGLALYHTNLKGYSFLKGLGNLNSLNFSNHYLSRRKKRVGNK